jgi:Uma2 family endonuclease
MFDPKLLEPETIRKLSRVEYDHLVAQGMFEDERVELLRGVLVTMSPQGGTHAAITAWFAQRLIRALDESYEVRSHSPLAASDDSEPEPDVSVSRHVRLLDHPSSALLLIEVAESSLRKDRLVKAAIYAEAGIPEYWIVDVSGEEILVEVYRAPTASGYAQLERLRAGDVLRPVELPQVALAIADIPWSS